MSTDPIGTVGQLPPVKGSVSGEENKMLEN